MPSQLYTDTVNEIKRLRSEGDLVGADLEYNYAIKRLSTHEAMILRDTINATAIGEQYHE